MSSPRRVLITGGAGFIGSNLVKHINSKAPWVEIVVLDDLSTGSRENLSETSVEFVQGTILSRSDLSVSLQGVDSVVHLAALGSVPRSIADPESTHSVNVTGTVMLLEEMRKMSIPNIFFSSSSSVYGANPKLPKSEEDLPRPLSPYAASKLAAESYVLSYGQCYSLRPFVARFFNVYGPNQSSGHAYAAVIPRFISAALEGGEIVVDGDGSQSRDFTFVESVCQAVLQVILEKMSHPSPVNLAFGTRTSILELVEHIKKASSTDVVVRHGLPRNGDVRASQADGILLKELFPQLEPIPLERGIRATVSAFKSSEAG